MKSQMLLCSLLLVLLLSTSANAILGSEITLEARTCSGTASTSNTSILASAISSGNVLILPEGKFEVDSVNINGVDGFTLKGTLDGGSIPVTDLSFADQTTGLTLSNTSNTAIRDLNISGMASAELVVLQTGGEFTAENLNIITNTADNSLCLAYNLDWLVPVLSILL